MSIFIITVPHPVPTFPTGLAVEGMFIGVYSHVPLHITALQKRSFTVRTLEVLVFLQNSEHTTVKSNLNQDR